jgi:Concanavalin A-like lectin/glucanases superfamily
MLLVPPLTAPLDYGSPLRYGEPLLRGLVSWWQCLPKRMGTPRLLDLAGTNHGTLTSMLPSSATAGWGPTTRPGGLGELRFNGTTSYVDCGTSATLDPLAITLSLWCKPTSLAGAYAAVFSCVYTAATNSYHQLMVRSDGKIACYVSAGGSVDVSYDGTGVATLTTNTWWHLVLTYDSVSGLVGYVNGVPDGTAAPSGPLDQQPLPTTTALGTDLATAGRFFAGALDAAALWSRALSAPEVASLTRAGRGGGPRLLRRRRMALSLGPNSLSRSSAGSALAVPTRLASNVRGSTGSVSTALSRSVGLQVPALVAFTSAPNTNNMNVTTAGITTTGATLLVVAVGSWSLSTLGTVSDSKGNTWTLLTAQSIASDPRIFLAYAVNPVVGTGHTFTYTGPTSGNLAYCSIAVQAFSGVRLASPFDGQNGAGAASVTSLATGVVTPTQAGDLLVTAFSEGATSTPTVSGGLSITSYIPTTDGVAVALAWGVQATIAASNPTWSTPAAVNMVVTQAAFKAAPVPLATTRTSQASGSVGRLASNVRVSAGAASQAGLRVGAALRTSPGTATEALQRLASQGTLRAGSALASAQSVASNVRLSVGSQASSLTGLRAASRASTGAASATRTSLLSASTTRSASALASVSGVSQATQTLSLHTTALALLLRTSQAATLFGLAQGLRTGSASIVHTSAGSASAAVGTFVRNVRHSLGQSTALPSALLSARQATTGETHASSLPRVLVTALGRMAGAFSSLVPVASQSRLLTGQALTTLQADLSARLVAQGVSVGEARGMASGALARVLLAQGRLVSTQSATLALSVVAAASSTGLAEAQVRLVGQAQVVGTRLASSVLTRVGQAWALGLLAPILSRAVTRPALAMARVQVLGRMQIGGEWHVVGPGNRRLQTIYPRAPLRIYRYLIRRH